jgi:integrase/recombinase XerC
MHPDSLAFLEHLTIIKRSPLTVRRYGDVLREFDVFTEGAAPGAIGVELLRRFATARTRAGLARAPAGVNLRVAVIRALFAYLVVEKGYGTNPAARLRGVPERRRTPKYLTARELGQLLAHATSATGPLAERNLVLAVVLWQTALRVSELARLTVAQFDPEARLLRGVILKGGDVLDVDVNEETIRLLDRYLTERRKIASDAPLFARSDGGRLSVRAIQAIFSGWRHELGWTRPLHPHVLRHTHATDALGLGVDIATVADLLRHKGLGSVLIYAKVQNPARRAALAKLGGLVPPAVLPPPAAVTGSEVEGPENARPANEGACVEDGFDAAA